MSISKIVFWLFVVFGGALLLPGCLAYNHLQNYTPSPGEFTLKDIHIWYRIEPTKTTRNIPFFLYGVEEFGPYFFRAHVFSFAAKPKVEMPTIILEHVKLIKNDTEYEIIEAPVILEMMPDQRWNDIYSRRQGRYQFNSTYECPRELPVNFETDKEFDIIVELAVSVGDRDFDYKHTVHYKKHHFRKKQWYWSAMMHV